MKKEIIAIDTDDVLADTLPILINWMNKTYDSNYSCGKMYKNDYTLSYLQIDKAEWIRRLDKFHSSPDYKKILPVKGAVKAVKN